MLQKIIDKLETYLTELKSKRIKDYGGYTQEEWNQKTEQEVSIITRLTTQINDLKNTISTNNIKNYPHNSLLEYSNKKYGLSFYRKYYTATQNGEKTKRQLHTYLQIDSDTFVKYGFLATKIIEKNTGVFATADDVVHFLIKQYCPTFNPNGNYRKEEGDIWRSAAELIEEYNSKGRILDDCDGFGIFLYTLIDAALSFTFPDERDRLKCQLCDVKGEYHFNLLWLRGGDLNDWVVIETTIYPENNSVYFNQPARMQNYMRSDYVFDREKEYEIDFKR